MRIDGHELIGSYEEETTAMLFGDRARARTPSLTIPFSVRERDERAHLSLGAARASLPPRPPSPHPSCAGDGVVSAAGESEHAARGGGSVDLRCTTTTWLKFKRSKTFHPAEAVADAGVTSPRSSENGDGRAAQQAGTV